MDVRELPADDYTPFGLVANPWAEARSWEVGTGGTLRTTEQRPGLAWLEPWATGPRQARGLELGCALDGRALLTRADLQLFGLTSPRRAAHWFEYRWWLGGLDWRARLFLVGPDALVARLTLHNTGSEPRRARLWLARWLWVGTDQPADTLAHLARASELQTDPACWPPEPARPVAERVAGRDGLALRSGRWLELEVGPDAEATLSAALGRGPAAGSAATAGLAAAAAREAELGPEQAAFEAVCPRLAGAWPPSLRRGLVYDFETTRQCLQPAGGIFRDVWPAWMVNWPRAVLAEGTLDLLRLSFAQPELAQRAILSLFRDAPAPNLPCVFRHGEPNMVAADGSICGTSPAWCVPFHNLRLLYLRTLDRVWLAELYPFLAAYLRWWLEHRSDQEGWTVYACTWEAGEDNSPRLDPDRQGDHVISAYARPVELQAAIAHAAATLRCFGRELGLGADEDATWAAVERAALARVQRLWDQAGGRFRDWDVRRGGFIKPSGRADYWGADPRRFSPLSLTPLLFGQVDAAQRTALWREIQHYTRPPWRDWPSWSYVALEAASAAGWYRFAGRAALATLERVYAENDRRALTPFERPLPGAAREYWPSDLAAWDASEGYGWGATTTSLLIRQLCGFYESPLTDRWAFRLAPGLPPGYGAGRRLELGPLPYRGRSVHLVYSWDRVGRWQVEVTVPGSERIEARVERRPTVEGGPGACRLTLAPGEAALVELPDRSSRAV